MNKIDCLNQATIDHIYPTSCKSLIAMGNNMIEIAIVICIIALAIMLFFAAYYCCDKISTVSSDSIEMQDYIRDVDVQPAYNINKVWKFLLIEFY